MNKTYDGLNRDAAIAAIGVSGGAACAASGAGYDCNGNLTNDGSRTFGYDLENRLVSAAPSTGVSASLQYDPLGRLQIYDVTTNGTANNTTFLYSGDKLVAEYNGTTLLRRYVHGVGEDTPLAWYEGSSSTTDLRYLHADNQGSIVGNSVTVH